jgi:hypothetical protein
MYSYTHNSKYFRAQTQVEKYFLIEKLKKVQLIVNVPVNVSSRAEEKGRKNNTGLALKFFI